MLYQNFEYISSLCSCADVYPHRVSA